MVRPTVHCWTWAREQVELAKCCAEEEEREDFSNPFPLIVFGARKRKLSLLSRPLRRSLEVSSFFRGFLGSANLGGSLISTLRQDEAPATGYGWETIVETYAAM